MKALKFASTVAALAGLALSANSALAGKSSDYMKEMDSNGDGQVSQVEFETAGSNKFTKADANRDGVLTKGELTGFMIDAKGKSGRKAEKVTDNKISKMDGNSDGNLTLQEFTDGHKQMFSNLDSDKSGNISMEEMEKGKH